MEDQVNYTVNNTPTNTTISDDDRDRFFEARPDFKEAADKAAIAKEAEKEAARIEKERIDKILAEHRGKTPAAYAYGPPIVNPYADYSKFLNSRINLKGVDKFRQLALKNLIDKKMGTKKNSFNVFELNNLLNPTSVEVRMMLLKIS